MKKRKGNIVGDVITFGMFLFAMSAVCLVVLGYISLGAYALEVKGYARNYLLRMETEGYMTPDAATALQQNLTDLGVKNIDLTGTTMSQVGYGQEIYLQINYDIPGERLNISSGKIMEFVLEDTLFHDEIKRKSTAKH